MKGEWIDISIPLHNGMVHWPGDAPFERRYTHSIANGDEANVSAFQGTVHMGTHMDAPRHYFEAGATIDTMPIQAGIGRARVIAIRDPNLIRVEELEAHHIAKGERVLFKTRNSGAVWKTANFQEKFVHFPKEAAAYLAKCEIHTIGVDYLSVGGYESDGAETHRILLSAGIWIIEGLNLEHVEPGDYELFCLPLKITGSEAAPARAVLRPLVL